MLNLPGRRTIRGGESATSAEQLGELTAGMNLALTAELFDRLSAASAETVAA